RRRLEACRRLGWTYIPVRVLNLDDPLQAEHDENSCRLDLTPSEAVDIARALEERERERARENQAAGLKRGKVRKGKLPARQKGRVRDRVAKGTGYSGKTLKKAQVVVAAAETQPEKFGPLKEEMDSSGKVDGACRKVIAEQQHPQQGQGPAARHRPLDSQVHELALAG